MPSNGLADKIDAYLPQTQCRKCGYTGCLPYATAIANNEAEINRCPPGGEGTIKALARLLQKDFKTLDPETGQYQEKRIAKIVESVCIGCTLCIHACPVDAIVGAAKQMHTVITDQCTGCELCISPCPVDCIEMLPLPSIHAQHGGFCYQMLQNSQTVFFGSMLAKLKANIARKRFRFRQQRLAKINYAKEQKLLQRKCLLNKKSSKQDKIAIINAAVARAKKRKTERKPVNYKIGNI